MKIPKLQTTEHILCKLLETDFSLKPGISKFDEEKGSLEVLTEKDMREIDLKKYEKMIQEVIDRNLEVKKYVLSREEAAKIVDLWKVPESAKEIRIIEIVGFDRRPCRDEHADRTGEIGKFKFLKIEHVGSGRYRFLFTVE